MYFKNILATKNFVAPIILLLGYKFDLIFVKEYFKNNIHEDKFLKLDSGKTLKDGISKEISELYKNLQFHSVSYNKVLNKLNRDNKVINYFENEISEEKFKISKSLNNFYVHQVLENVLSEIRKINVTLLNFLNILEDNFIKTNDEKSFDKFEFDFNTLIEEIKVCENFKIDYINNITNKDDKKYDRLKLLIDYLFLRNEVVTLRVFSNLVIFNKNSSKNKLNNDQIKFIEDYAKEQLNEQETKHNEEKLYFAKKVLINLYSHNDYFYQDYLMEINHKTNLKDIKNGKISDDRAFDYDIVFISGLNANFNSYRIPLDEMNLIEPTFKHYLEFFMNRKHGKIIFGSPHYKLWSPQMFETSFFQDKKIRYLVTFVESKFFVPQLQNLGIPDFSTDEYAERIYHSFLNARIGDRPLILICHSMGGLICKKIIEIAKKEDKIIKNIKGIVFYSVPHFGTDVVSNLIEIGFKKYLRLFSLFETTSSEFGFLEEDVLDKISDGMLSRSTRDICLSPKGVFGDLHENFKKHSLNYICINETEQTLIDDLGIHVDIVKPESSCLPETENYFLNNTVHGDLQKYSPNDFEEQGFVVLSNFIKKCLD